MTLWHGQRCHWIVADGQSGVFTEYFPRGRRTAADVGRTFPLGPPRRTRDQFAPATSLLDGIWIPTSQSGRGLA
ncbi:hypothetical protein [Microbacterium immunditiarum]|uniref:Uncharacterized protein n=1 Tax=Microbacterium immunditiarum TaxID=337480 RepID=A0A7Y9GKL7_9MICO|nr:hypothetical protein [Microbacterium immunditiarum]NYE18056.1 hypothetical protein [Microbacterium immunditiarum]